jgi:hypothetical protein
MIAAKLSYLVELCLCNAMRNDIEAILRNEKLAEGTKKNKVWPHT